MKPSSDRFRRNGPFSRGGELRPAAGRLGFIGEEDDPGRPVDVLACDGSAAPDVYIFSSDGHGTGFTGFFRYALISKEELSEVSLRERLEGREAGREGSGPSD